MTDIRTVPLGGQEESSRLMPVTLVLAGMSAQQLGSAVAALLFPMVGAAGMVALRQLMSALVLLAVCRPVLRGYSRGDWAVICGFGLALAAMNGLFYQAVARIPLGAAVTLEVLGPLGLSVVAGRRPVSALWAALALAGVALLGRGGLTQLTGSGVAFALGAGAMWAVYILASKQAGTRFPGADGLALAMAVAAVVSLPIGIADAGGALLRPEALGAGLAVALLCSAVPYTLELLALRRLSAGAFGVLLSLSPALAALAGFTVLDQQLSPAQMLAIALVVVACTGAVRTGGSGARSPRHDRVGTRVRRGADR
ncbi:EamA family transporter [Pseudonocardia sp. CA-107938]|uniref:EamA family transporter n=1 Tax=Pseudonocardia sp. CA-107938 TaxID=3240021 RepID=UPI003D8B9CA7